MSSSDRRNKGFGEVSWLVQKIDSQLFVFSML